MPFFGRVIGTAFIASIGMVVGWGARANAEQMHEVIQRQEQNQRASEATNLRRRTIELQAEQKSQEASLREAKEALNAANEKNAALQQAFERRERELNQELQRSTERAAKLEEEVRVAKEHIAELEVKSTKAAAAAAATSRRSILGGFMH